MYEHHCCGRQPPPWPQRSWPPGIHTLVWHPHLECGLDYSDLIIMNRIWQRYYDINLRLSYEDWLSTLGVLALCLCLFLWDLSPGGSQMPVVRHPCGKIHMTGAGVSQQPRDDLRSESLQMTLQLQPTAWLQSHEIHWVKETKLSCIQTLNPQKLWDNKWNVFCVKLWNSGITRFIAIGD